MTVTANRNTTPLINQLPAATLSPQSSVLSPQSSVLSPQSSVLSPQSSVLSPQSPVLSPQSSVPSPQSSPVDSVLDGHDERVARSDRRGRARVPTVQAV